MCRYGDKSLSSALPGKPIVAINAFNAAFNSASLLTLSNLIRPFASLIGSRVGSPRAGRLSSPPLPFRRSIPIALEFRSTPMSGPTRADKAMFRRVSLLVGSSRATANCGSQSRTSSWTIPRCRSVPRLGGCLSQMGEWGPQESLHYEDTVLLTRVSGISEVNRPNQSRFVQRTGATFAEVCPKQRRH